MILQEISFTPENYQKLEAFQQLLKKDAKKLGFEGYSEKENVIFREEKLGIPGGTVISCHTAYSLSAKDGENVLMGLYLYPNQKDGKISFITFSKDLFLDCVKKVKELANLEEVVETKSSVDFVLEMGYK